VTVDSIFDAGLILQAAIDLPPGVTAQRITEALRRLDDVVRDIRDHVFAERGQGIDPGLARRPSPQVLERSARAKDQSELLQRHVAQTARALQSAAATPQPFWSGGPSFSASQGTSIIQPRPNAGGPLPIGSADSGMLGSSRDLTGDPEEAATPSAGSRCTATPTASRRSRRRSRTRSALCVS
jgi:hypothetical protein